MTNLEFTLEVLKQLEVTSEIKNGKLYINPTSSPMMECLPGKWIDVEDEEGFHYTVLECDIEADDLINPALVASLIRSLEDYI